MIKHFFIIAIAFMGLVALNSCESEVDEREADELIRLDAYMSIHYPDQNPTKSGMYVIIIEEGQGGMVGLDDFILYNYSGRNLNDNIFETSSKTEAKLHDIFSPKVHYAPQFKKYINEATPLIKGLKEGLGYIKEGTKARFIIPSKLAFGGSTYKGLQPYSSVIYDIELIKVVADPEVYETSIINNFLQENYPDFILKNGVYLLEEIEDEDEENLYIRDEDVVNVNYTGMFLDGFIFDTNIYTVAEENGIYESNKQYAPIKVTVGDNSNYIEGFSITLKAIATNTTAKVLIPSKFAYKELGNQTIPSYTPLIFDIIALNKTTDDDDNDDTI